MKNILRKIKLLDHLTTEIEIEKSEFISIFKSNIDQGSIRYYADFSEIFSSSNNKYTGQVLDNEFEIRDCRRLNVRRFSYPIAKGKYIQNNETLTIETEINGFSKAILPFYIGSIIIFSTLFGAFIFDGHTAPWYTLPFLLLLAFFFLGAPYYILKINTLKMKNELDRFFHTLNK